MKNWEIFEQNATQFLNTSYSDFIFKNLGSTDSSLPDIEVYNKQKEHIFNIEAKYSPSQAGQIVVLIENGVFKFSEKSKNRKVQATDKIIQYLNNNYDKYAEVVQTSIDIDIDNDILFSFIIEQYKSKGCEWIIASKIKSELSTDTLCLIPIEEISNHFTVSSGLRRKKSGTAPLPKTMRNKASEIISTICEKPIIQEEGKKTYLIGDIAGHSLELPEMLYLSKKEHNHYEIKKRSSTNNINIMFSLKLKDDFPFMGKEFKQYLDNF
jgi:hypothetical protein